MSAYAVSYTLGFQSCKTSSSHLKGTLAHGLRFNLGSFVINGYLDADWEGDAMDRRSTTGYCVFLGSNLISWSAKKQPTVARSSTDAKHRPLSQLAAEVTWIRMLLADLSISSPSVSVLWCDNLSALSLATNPVFHACIKHIEVDYHFVRQKVLAKNILLCYVPSVEQLTDVFTKPLSVARFNYLSTKLMGCSSPTLFIYLFILFPLRISSLKLSIY